MKSTTLKKSNSSNEPPQLETSLKIDAGITRDLLSGVRRATIRRGTRHFAKNITIHGYSAEVQKVTHTTLLHTPFSYLQEKGFKNLFQALMGLQKYYPGITLHDPITIIEFRLNV
jgi:hypothetical protein